MCAIVAQREHFSLRLSADAKRALERQAAERGESKTRLAERYLEEAVQAATHPGVVFRDGPAGRRPGLAGGPDVWEVIEVYLHEDREAAAAADTLGVPRGLVEVAIGYYADHRTEIDSWIDTNRRLLDEAEAGWRRRQAIGSS